MTEIFDPPKDTENIVLGAIRALEANRTPVRLEIEHANINFYSVLTVKRSQIVVGKPPGLKKGISQGGRFAARWFALRSFALRSFALRSFAAR